MNVVGKSMTISHGLAESASEQAAALEETSASLNQTASMTKQTAADIREANQLMGRIAAAPEEQSVGIKRLQPGSLWRPE
jgi:methyl-accepting chemotaxis protein